TPDGARQRPLPRAQQPGARCCHGTGAPARALTDGAQLDSDRSHPATPSRKHALDATTPSRPRVTTAEAVGIIGELMSWIGGVVGILCLAVALLLRMAGGKHQPVQVTVVDDLEQRLVAIWTVDDRTYSQALDPSIRLSDWTVT